MGKLKIQEMKVKAYKALTHVNDRAWSLITIFSMSVSITTLDILFNITNRLSSLTYAFIALATLVISTILSSACKSPIWFRKLSAVICVFLWLFVAKLSGVLQSANMLHLATFYAVLFWSNINLLGVFLNGRK